MANYYKYLLCLCLLVLCLGSAKGQQGFSLVNLETDKTRTFKYGSKVLFELKNKLALDSTMKSCLNQETGVYEMRLTKLLGQDLVFNDSILVPYSQIKWMFIETSDRIASQIVGFLFMGTLVPIYGLGIEFGLGASILFLPPAVGFLILSQKHYYSSDYWAIKPAMLAGR
ncbi:MAG: hypothetical protein CFE21_10660 [Bacteroidetes bacterium B1(2017)]|nr:MAG: hypothetical protein CFE21_10660 [Bacteroidetes bacterium B1(2017)]